tara:strand:- start:865 stop:1482 length:618 start_codon:yes stop_codon:yes gene_type:complete
MKTLGLGCWALLLILLILSGCGTTDVTPGETDIIEQPEPPKIKETNKEPFELALQLEDFPVDSGWQIQDRSERTPSDVSEEAVENGWIGGYQTLFLQTGDNILIYTKVRQILSIYTPEGTGWIKNRIETWNKYGIWVNETNHTVDKLSGPEIGEVSSAIRIKTKDQTWYEIEFLSKNVYMMHRVEGTSVDYELLKELARTAEAKI